MFKRQKELEDKLSKMVENKQDKTAKFGEVLKEYYGLGNQVQLSELTKEQKAKMKVEHYTLHLPANFTPEQLRFVQTIAQSVERNEPITIVHEKALQYLLKWAYNYRNILTEFDEQDRWSEEDDMSLEKIAKEFKPILDYLIEQYKLNVSKFRRD